MRPSKILIGQILIVFGVILATLWGATQWTAYALGYQAGLGAPWFILGDSPVYKPWRLFQWWYAYEAYAPDIFTKAGLIASSGGFFSVLAAVLGSVWRSRYERNVTTYGSARWADTKDLRQAELLGDEGVFLGRWKGQYLRHNGPEHVLAFAPTRSGKGVGLVIPTLLSWTGSAVIHDIKGENWQKTSGWRATFSRCIRFDPTDPSSPRFNPLSEVRLGANEVRDVQNIVDILVDPEGSLERRNHWEKTAHALLVGVILHVLYAGEDKTLTGCARVLADPTRTFEKTLGIMLNTKHTNGETHPVVAEAARDLLNKSENERSGVLSTAISFLTLYRDPVIAKVTGASDWSVIDLIAGATPTSLYLVVPPSDLSRTKPLVRLVLNQIGRCLTEELPDEGRRKVLFMLDEFPALGRLDFFESALAFMAGYGVRTFLIAQSLNQIEKAYGPNNSILDNCHVRVAFATNDERTAKRISEALGTKTELRSQKNYAGHRLAPWLSHMMVSRQETSRPLLTPGEVIQLPPADELVMISGCPPIRAKKLRYFKDRNFTERIMEQAMTATVERSNDDMPVSFKQGASKRAEEGDTVDGLEPPLGARRPKEPDISEETFQPDPNDGLDTVADEELTRTIRSAAMDRGDDDYLPLL